LDTYTCKGHPSHVKPTLRVLTEYFKRTGDKQFQGDLFEIFLLGLFYQYVLKKHGIAI